MLLILLSWIYISFIFFALGLPFVTLISRIVESNEVRVKAPHVSIVMICGVIVSAVVASVLSLLIPLAGLANALMLLLAVICIWVFRQNAAALRKKLRQDLLFTPRLLIVLFIAFAFIVAYLASQVSSHYDDGLYYGTTIRWIEEHGVVNGLANVNTRIGYNSTWLLLQAMFSFHYFHLGHFTTLNGLLLLIVIAYTLGGLNRLYLKEYSMSVIVRALSWVPLVAFHFGASSDFMLFNVNYLSAPSADLPVCMLCWLAFVWLLELDELPAHEHAPARFYIMAVAVFLFIVKASAAPLLLACVYFFFELVFKKRFVHAGAALMIALLIVAPWIARNVIVSGYVIYPFSALDIVNADWKLPIAHVKWHENAVRSFAIDPEADLSKTFNTPISQWFEGWFGRLTFIQSLIFLFSIASLVSLLAVFAVQLVRHGKSFLIANRFFIISVLIAAAGFAFWFVKGPDPRLGYGFAGMLTMLLIALMLRYFLDRDVRYVGYLLTIFFIYVMVFYYKGTWKDITRKAWTPLPERRMPEQTKQVPLGNGVMLNIVFKQDSWYSPLPVADNVEHELIQPVLRGTNISEGFKASEKK